MVAAILGALDCKQANLLRMVEEERIREAYDAGVRLGIKAVAANETAEALKDLRIIRGVEETDSVEEAGLLGYETAVRSYGELLDAHRKFSSLLGKQDPIWSSFVRFFEDNALRSQLEQSKATHIFGESVWTAGVLLESMSFRL